MINVESTKGIGYNIENIIKEAQKKIVLITPYIKIPSILFERLQSADKKGVSIIVVYGKSELKRKEKEQFESLENCQLYFKENLHAKVYLNEHSCVIASMNLYDYSEMNNVEIGVCFDKKEYNLFKKINEETEYIIENSEIVLTHQQEEDMKIINKITGSKSHRDFPIKEFPTKSTYVTKEYGFVTFHFYLGARRMKKIRDTHFPKMEELLSDYSVYWNSPYNRLSVYNKNGSYDDEEYKKFAVEKLVHIIRNEIQKKL